MNCLIKLKKLFRRNAGDYEVWDTSAISNWLDIFQTKVRKGNEKIIVSEGVKHELSAGRHASERCKEAYLYVKACEEQGIIKIILTKDSRRAWSIDEQVISAAEDLYKKGYNVTLVTCDRDQADRAKYKNLKIRLLKGNRPAAQQKQAEEKTVLKTIQPKKVEEHKRENPTMGVVDEVPNELSLPCVAKDKKRYITVKSYKLAVYDSSGKRKIPKDGLIEVTKLDTLIYRENKYRLQSIGDTMKFVKIK